MSYVLVRRAQHYHLGGWVFLKYSGNMFKTPDLVNCVDQQDLTDKRLIQHQP